VSQGVDQSHHDPGALDAYLRDLGDFLRRSRVARRAEDEPRRQPLRQALLDALDDLRYPTTSRTLAAFLAARVGRETPSNQFGRIAAQERAAFRRGGEGARPVWLGSGVAADDFRAIKNVWGRSDWALDWRVVAPTSSRVQHLRATEALCRLAERAEEEAQDPDALRALALAHAKDLPDVRVNRAAPDFGRYAVVARELVHQYEPEDRRRRLEAAQALAAMPAGVRLFGIERAAPRSGAAA
jgi:hypothetical protein